MILIIILAFFGERVLVKLGLFYDEQELQKNEIESDNIYKEMNLRGLLG